MGDEAGQSQMLRRRAPLAFFALQWARVLAAAMNLLTDTPAEAALAIAIATARTGPKHLFWLALVCRRFAIKCIAAPPHRTGTASGGTAAAAQQQAEMWSIIEEAARQWIGTCTNQEQGWVPRRGRESWLGLMWEVEVLRRGAVFGRSHESITLSEGGALATKAVGDYVYRDVASKAVMRAGRHYAQFTVERGFDMYSGVIRPGWDVEAGHRAQHVDGHCFYSLCSGSRFPCGTDWEGREPAMEDGDRIGLLLDLDQGTMTVYKNDERLGVMATGLGGEYSWAVAIFTPGSSARIESAPAPASPTAEELTSANDWFARAAARERRIRLELPLTATDAECAVAEAYYQALDDDY
eukprot:COSAG06_NODE_2813_length_6243_cov_7.236165_8_plen_353_part_00